MSKTRLFNQFLTLSTQYHISLKNVLFSAKFLRFGYIQVQHSLLNDVKSKPEIDFMQIWRRRHGTWNSRRLDSWFKSLYMLTTKIATKPHVTVSLCHRRAFPWHDIVTQRNTRSWHRWVQTKTNQGKNNEKTAFTDDMKKTLVSPVC